MQNIWDLDISYDAIHTSFIPIINANNQIFRVTAKTDTFTYA